VELVVRQDKEESAAKEAPLALVERPDKEVSQDKVAPAEKEALLVPVGWQDKAAPQVPAAPLVLVDKEDQALSLAKRERVTRPSASPSLGRRLVLPSSGTGEERSFILPNRRPLST